MSFFHADQKFARLLVASAPKTLRWIGYMETMMGVQGRSDFEPLLIAEQGSFFVGGRRLSVPGEFQVLKRNESAEGQSFPVDHLFVRYQVPLDAHRLPVVMVHGQGQFGKTWESTPDGREGFQTLFLRQGHPVYVVDFPRRGGAGIPSFKGPAGSLDGRLVVAPDTHRFSDQEAFVYFRLGPAYGEYFANTKFPKPGLEQFLRQNMAHFDDDYDTIVEALTQLLALTGPAILMTHSQSGHFGWRMAINSDQVRAIVSFEPGPIKGCLFPRDQMPESMPLYDGSPVSFATEVDAMGFTRLARVPILVMHGDNIPKAPVQNWYMDIWRIREAFVRRFCEVLQGQGGRADFVSLPELGIAGNTHFPFADTNTRELAALSAGFLRELGL